MSSLNDSNDDILDMFPYRLENEIIVEAFALQEKEHERVRNEQRWSDMNRQIMELTSPVRIIAERGTSHRREGNDVLATASTHAIFPTLGSHGTLDKILTNILRRFYFFQDHVSNVKNYDAKVSLMVLIKSM